MFTGIVEETGTVERIKPTARSIELTVRARFGGQRVKLGASVAINGCCLTAVKLASRGKSGCSNSTCSRKPGSAPTCNSPSPAPS